jgi:hypothetical protein
MSSVDLRSDFWIQCLTAIVYLYVAICFARDIYGIFKSYKKYCVKEEDATVPRATTQEAAASPANEETRSCGNLEMLFKDVYISKSRQSLSL